MAKTNSNYAQEKKGKKKIALALVLLISALVLIIGVIAAYYSDVINETGDLTTSTLRLNGSYSFFLNDTETTLDGLSGLNPGDVIVVKGTVTNEGSQSAWIREKFVFASTDQTILSYLEIYYGEYSQYEIATGEDLPKLSLAEDGSVTGINKVIDGSGTDAQTETDNDDDYYYLGTSEYDFAFTIHFVNTAPNSTQGKTFSFTVSVQALQFRNNNYAEPNETAWLAAVPARQD